MKTYFEDKKVDLWCRMENVCENLQGRLFEY